MKRLLSEGVDPNTPNGRDFLERSALHWDVGNGHTSSVGALVQARADVNAVSEAGNTPLRWAENWEHPEVARLLEAAGGRRG